LAGEIAQEVAVALALGSAAIGAAGSVLSQAVGGYITGKREKRRADAEEKRWSIESDAKRRDRSLDQKVELFSRYLALIGGIERDEMWGRPVSTEAFMAYNETLDEVQQIIEEIGLIAPELHRFVAITSKRTVGMLFSRFGEKYENGDPGELAAGKRAHEDLQFWIAQTRIAFRSYINHEPVEWPEQAIAEHKAALRKSKATDLAK